MSTDTFTGKQMDTYVEGYKLRGVQDSNPSPEMADETILEHGNKDPMSIEVNVTAGMVTLNNIDITQPTLMAVVTGQSPSSATTWNPDNFVNTNFWQNRLNATHDRYDGSVMVFNAKPITHTTSNANDSRSTLALDLKGNIPRWFKGRHIMQIIAEAADFSPSGAAFIAEFAPVPIVHGHSDFSNPYLLDIFVDSERAIPTANTLLVDATPTPFVQNALASNLTGGSLVNGTYHFRIEAFAADNRQVALSSAQNIILAGGTNTETIDVSWNAVVGAARYRIYYGGATGVYTSNQSLVATVEGQATVTYTVTSVASLGFGMLQPLWCTLTLAEIPATDCIMWYCLHSQEYPFVDPNFPIDETYGPLVEVAA